jgi:hypothetical protein
MKQVKGLMQALTLVIQTQTFYTTNYTLRTSLFASAVYFELKVLFLNETAWYYTSGSTILYTNW